MGNGEQTRVSDYEIERYGEDDVNGDKDQDVEEILHIIIPSLDPVPDADEWVLEFPLLFEYPPLLVPVQVSKCSCNRRCHDVLQGVSTPFQAREGKHLS